MTAVLETLLAGPAPGTATTACALAAMVFLLGMRHGLDADHLATVDGLSRCNLQQRPRLARWCGALFSLGHGAVVVLVAVAVSQLDARWQVPAWLAQLGDGISVLFLLTLALANLAVLLRSDARVAVPLVGLRGRWFAKLLMAFGRVSHGASVMGIGALFALSFDTLSQAALFSYTGSHYGGWRAALGLGLLFTFGMLLTDGLNGWFITRLIGRADALACIVSRCMSLTVSMLSLLVALLIVLPHLAPQADEWIGQREYLWSLLLVLAVPVAYVAARRLARGQHLLQPTPR